MTEPSNVPVKEKLLLVFKTAAVWNEHIIRKFSLAYDVEYLFADEIFRQGGSVGLVKAIERHLVGNDISIAAFDIDFYRIFDYGLLSRLSYHASVIIAVSFDDLVLHRQNLVTAGACDIVLLADPIAVLKYRERGYQAEYLALEASKTVYYDRELPRDIDVLHFGVEGKADRRIYLDYLARHGVHVQRFGQDTTYLLIEKLPEYISRAKVVVNFSKTDLLDRLHLGETYINDVFLQMKGRVIEASLSHTPCVSEYSPVIDLLFPAGGIPVFSTPEECLSIIRHLLADGGERQRLADLAHAQVLAYEDAAQMEKIKAAVDRIKAGRRRPAVRVGPSYLATVAAAKLDVLKKRPGLLLKEAASLYATYKLRCRPALTLAILAASVIRVYAARFCRIRAS